MKDKEDSTTIDWIDKSTAAPANRPPTAAQPQENTMNHENQANNGSAAAPQHHAPTLASSAMKVSLSISVPTLRKKDKAATLAVQQDNEAAKNSGTYTKKLLSSAIHASIKTLEGQIRAYHTAKTVPWGDLGERLLPNILLIDYQNDMKAFFKQFDVLKGQFRISYPQEVERAKQHYVGLGKMFNAADYPPVDVLMEKFKIRCDLDAIANLKDWRCDLEAQGQQEIVDTLQATNDARLKEVMDDIWKRLLAPLKNMSEKLDYDDATGKPRNGYFKGTLVDNVTQIVDLMKLCNIANDPKMEQVRRDLKDALTGVTYDGLKASDTMRDKVKGKVDKIIKGIEPQDTPTANAVAPTTQDTSQTQPTGELEEVRTEQVTGLGW